MTTVLVVGGYGAVGSELCRILSRDGDLDLVVAGRNLEKASRLATALGASSRVGIKLGATHTYRRAERFLRVLRWLGKGDDVTNDIGLEVVVTGEKDGRRQRRSVSMHCSEEYATALALAILCRQIARGLVTARGAFVPHQAVAIGDFVEQLRVADVHLTAKVETLENGTRDSQDVMP